jgi:hypothetical protein
VPTTTYPAWKPSPLFADLMSEPVPTTPTAPSAPAASHAWGFGAPGANKLWTPPTEPPVPLDWWKENN